MNKTIVTTINSQKRRKKIGFLILIFILTICSVIYLCYGSLSSSQPQIGKYFKTENKNIDWGYSQYFECIINIRYEGQKESDTSFSVRYDDTQDERENCIPLPNKL